MVKVERRHCRLKRAASKPDGYTGGKLDPLGNRRRYRQRYEWRTVHLWHRKSGKATLLERPYCCREIRAAAKEDTCPIASFHSHSPYPRIRLMLLNRRTTFSGLRKKGA